MRADLHRRVVIVAPAGLEVVKRDHDPLASDQPAQLVVDQRQVEGLRRLEVVVAVLVLRVKLQVEEVVVHRQRYQVEAHLGQHVGQLGGGRGLARGGGAGDDDQLQRGATLADHLRRGGDVLVIGPVGLAHDVGELAAADAGVEARHRVQVVINGPAQHLPDLPPGDVLGRLGRTLGAFAAASCPLVAV